ncbi:hypothetical protein SARC_05500 [Sphaeroforma arctica JP610]|uniref:Uncharacterized protein n=1 Tax=Sphaeroforma arctica JP610 TaxID=667725 RepID=A0A0L0FZE2_9EUKA|nr:hypothetical protein SARC_05500 [Sphaeroforma arctica JP610]KNC82202.1 hypothetical protein SARC_05500 [Sphaeroforma arctica JP610]|eukprot:XP_014156104.1 hypothetical protein SARC_05500 [Sphaeroforma arctica JP610]
MVFPLQPNTRNYNQPKLQLHSHVELIETTANTFLQNGTEITGPPKWRYVCVARAGSTKHVVPPITALLDAEAKCILRPRALTFCNPCFVGKCDDVQSHAQPKTRARYHPSVQFSTLTSTRVCQRPQQATHAILNMSMPITDNLLYTHSDIKTMPLQHWTMRRRPVSRTTKDESTLPPVGTVFHVDLHAVFHVDLHAGLPTSPTGYTCNIKYVDANNGQPFVYPLRHKDDATATLDVFYTDIGKDYLANLRELKCDRGGEFVSKEFRSTHYSISR